MKKNRKTWVRLDWVRKQMAERGLSPEEIEDAIAITQLEERLTLMYFDPKLLEWRLQEN